MFRGGKQMKGGVDSEPRVHLLTVAARIDSRHGLPPAMAPSPHGQSADVPSSGPCRVSRGRGGP